MYICSSRGDNSNLFYVGSSATYSLKRGTEWKGLLLAALGPGRGLGGQLSRGAKMPGA
jgi:hypothetical protein